MEIAIWYKKIDVNSGSKLSGQKFREEEYGEDIQLWENASERRKPFVQHHLYV